MLTKRPLKIPRSCILVPVRCPRLPQERLLARVRRLALLAIAPEDPRSRRLMPSVPAELIKHAKPSIHEQSASRGVTNQNALKGLQHVSPSGLSKKTCAIRDSLGNPPQILSISRMLATGSTRRTTRGIHMAPSRLGSWKDHVFRHGLT